MVDEKIADLLARVPKEKIGGGEGERRAWLLSEVDGIAYMAMTIGDEWLCTATASSADGKMGGMGCSPIAVALDSRRGLVSVQTSKARSWASVLVPDEVVTVALIDADGIPVEAAVSGNLAMVEVPNAARAFTLTARDGTTAEILLPPPLD